LIYGVPMHGLPMHGGPQIMMEPYGPQRGLFGSLGPRGPYFD